eukprot:m.120107 g.120107  ORF g.120107 m.120107 type:complete len:187 (+) comp37725_c0_seq1:424-984(+)
MAEKSEDDLPKLVLVTAENTKQSITGSKAGFPEAIQYVSAYSTKGLWIIYSQTNFMASAREDSALVRAGTGKVTLSIIKSCLFVDHKVDYFQTFSGEYYSEPGPSYRTDASSVFAQSLVVFQGSWILHSDINFRGYTSNSPARPTLEYPTLFHMGFEPDDKVEALKSIRGSIERELALKSTDDTEA